MCTCVCVCARACVRVYVCMRVCARLCVCARLLVLLRLFVRTCAECMGVHTRMQVSTCVRASASAALPPCPAAAKARLRGTTNTPPASRAHVLFATDADPGKSLRHHPRQHVRRPGVVGGARPAPPPPLRPAPGGAPCDHVSGPSHMRLCADGAASRAPLGGDGARPACPTLPPSHLPTLPPSHSLTLSPGQPLNLSPAHPRFPPPLPKQKVLPRSGGRVPAPRVPGPSTA